MPPADRSCEPLDVAKLKFKRRILEAAGVSETIGRMAAEVVSRNGGVEDLMLVGIRTRGVPLAELMGAGIRTSTGVDVPVGMLDITLYRDDLSTIASQPVVKSTHFPGPIEGKTLILCDDVLYTGRTIRAALDELADFGRPRSVQLAVLVDRGLRELPIHADIVGLALETTPAEIVEVRFEATDGETRIDLMELGER